MNLADIKRRHLNFSELLKASFAVWLKGIWPSAKISFVLFLLFFAGLISLFICLNFMSFGIWSVFSFMCLQLFYFISAVTLFSYIFFCEDFADGKKTAAFENIAKVLLKIHRILGVFVISAAFLAVTYLPLLFFKNPMIVLPFILVLFILYIIVIPFFIFAPMAIYLRDAGVIDSLKYSYYMVKGRWIKILAWLMVCSFIGAALFFAAGLILAVALKVFIPWISERFFSFMLSGAVGANYIPFILISVAAAAFAVIFLIVFLYSFMMSANSVVFLNLELKPEPEPEPEPEHEGIEISSGKSAPHEITEIFKNIKPVDVNVSADTEKLSALGRPNREEALREFKKEDNSLPAEVEDPSIPQTQIWQDGLSSVPQSSAKK